jgi:hypothetical protein
VTPYELHSVRFLCPFGLKMAAAECAADGYRPRKLERQLVDGAVLEDFVMCSASLTPRILDSDKWEFYHNPGHDVLLTVLGEVNDVLKQDPVDFSIGHHKKVYFSQSFLSVAVNSLDPEAVYVSTLASIPDGEFLTYNQKVNQITLYKMSIADPKHRPYSVNSLKRYIQGDTVNLQILYFVPGERSSVKGVGVVMGPNDEGKDVNE